MVGRDRQKKFHPEMARRLRASHQLPTTNQRATHCGNASVLTKTTACLSSNSFFHSPSSLSNPASPLVGGTTTVRTWYFSSASRQLPWPFAVLEKVSIRLP